MNRLHTVLVLACTFALGCGAASPTRELESARTTYQQASFGAAGKVAPAKVYEAKKALNKAEAAHEDDPGSLVERHLGYIAWRISETAIAQAELVNANARLATAKTRFETARRATTERALARARRSLSEETYRAAELEHELQGEQEKRQQAEQDKVKADAQREAAEAKAEEALRTLETIAKLRQEERGLVITLQGSVLFETGKSEIMPNARRVLDEVAEALKAQKNEKTILIEGHTDSVGDDSANMALSQARAEAVRNYLIGRGLHPARLRAVGRGEASPVTSNDKVEGRAQNRRVEIIVSDVMDDRR
jgi:outer membrane protein OmpA-like peptidoglycan-associated protein